MILFYFIPPHSLAVLYDSLPSRPCSDCGFHAAHFRPAFLYVCRPLQVQTSVGFKSISRCHQSSQKPVDQRPRNRFTASVIHCRDLQQPSFLCPGKHPDVVNEQNAGWDHYLNKINYTKLSSSHLRRLGVVFKGLGILITPIKELMRLCNLHKKWHRLICVLKL